jgi:MFS transporter, DHA2 family, methylenomycin A resistance protein
MADSRHENLILATMCLGTFMAILDTSLVNLGLHSIQRDLQADISVLQWVIDIYNLVYAALILTGGLLGDLYGRRRVFLIGVVVFAAGSLICAVAPNATLLITGRGIAGIGAALELPVALAILNISYPEPKRRARAIAVWGGMNGLAMAIGPTLGGVLVDQWGWRSVFYAILPVAAAAYGMGQLNVPQTSDPKGRHLDIPGQILVILALGSLCLAFIESPKFGWTSPWILGCLIVSAISTIGFVVVEHRTPGPLIPLSTFSNRPFAAAVGCAGLMTFGMYGLLFILPLYLQAERGASAAQAGIELLPMSLTFFVVSFFAGRVATSLGPRILISSGMTLAAGSLFALARLSPQSNYGVIGAALFANGVGLALITGPIFTAAVANAPAERSGMSSGLVNVGRMVGATLGVAVLGLFFGERAADTTKNVAHFMTGMRAAFIVGGVAVLAGAVTALIAFRRDSLHPAARA